MQRALLEDDSSCRDALERTWSNLCDHTPLGPLLVATCPLYGNWVLLLTQPAHWPLPPQLLHCGGGSGVGSHPDSPASSSGTSSPAEQQVSTTTTSSSATCHQYLGGQSAQHRTDPQEREAAATEARMAGARMLGKLAGFVVRPVPGLDYSKVRFLLKNIAFTCMI